jgi:hypothetical protein
MLRARRSTAPRLRTLRGRSRAGPTPRRRPPGAAGDWRGTRRRTRIAAGVVIRVQQGLQVERGVAVGAAKRDRDDRKGLAQPDRPVFGLGAGPGTIHEHRIIAIGPIRGGQGFAASQQVDLDEVSRADEDPVSPEDVLIPMPPLVRGAQQFQHGDQLARGAVPDLQECLLLDDRPRQMNPYRGFENGNAGTWASRLGTTFNTPTTARGPARCGRPGNSWT